VEHDNEKRSWPELNDDVRESWDANAAFWDSKMGEGNAFHLQLVGPTVERLLGISPGERVIDVACGNGQFSRRLAELGATVLAFDIAPGMIEAARRRTKERPDLLERISFNVLDATDESVLVALGEGQANAAVCNMAIMDMAEIAPMLKALRRALVPGGRFVFSTAHPSFNHSGMRLVMEERIADGELIVERSVRIVTYKSTGAAKGIAMIGQPKSHWYFERTLAEILNVCFAAGFVLDGIEESSFPEEDVDGGSPGWQAYPEIPPVLAARLRPA
jgi:2-polyprenyl-3-methyl-5-hydroxy-6-metoxy-1,4-benzoquinol methylase